MFTCSMQLENEIKVFDQQRARWNWSALKKIETVFKWFSLKLRVHYARSERFFFIKRVLKTEDYNMRKIDKSFQSIYIKSQLVEDPNL